MLPHRALVRAHQGFAQFVLAQGGGQAAQQQQQHGLEEHGRLGSIWRGVRHRARGPRSSEDRLRAWSDNHRERVNIPTTILPSFEWRGQGKLTPSASRLINSPNETLNRQLSLTVSRQLLTAPERNERGTVCCFDG